MFLLEVGHFGHLLQVVREMEGKCTSKKLTGQIGLGVWGVGAWLRVGAGIVG
jgi:hypothetical protein